MSDLAEMINAIMGGYATPAQLELGKQTGFLCTGCSGAMDDGDVTDCPRYCPECDQEFNPR